LYVNVKKIFYFNFIIAKKKKKKKKNTKIGSVGDIALHKLRSRILIWMKII